MWMCGCDTIKLAQGVIAKEVWGEGVIPTTGGRHPPEWEGRGRGWGGQGHERRAGKEEKQGKGIGRRDTCVGRVKWNR